MFTDMNAKFPRVLSEDERKEVLLYLKNRFGIPFETFDDYEILRGVSNFWLYPKNNCLPLVSKLQIQTVGLLFLRKVSRYLKPTSAFLQRFGYLATKNIVQLSSEQIKEIKENKKIPLELDIEPGYVILRDENWILGCGLYVSGKLVSYLEEKLLRNL